MTSAFWKCLHQGLVGHRGMKSHQPSLSSKGDVIWRMLEELLDPQRQKVQLLITWFWKEEPESHQAQRKLPPIRRAAAPCLWFSAGPLFLPLPHEIRSLCSVHTAGNGHAAQDWHSFPDLDPIANPKSQGKSWLANVGQMTTLCPISYGWWAVHL